MALQTRRTLQRTTRGLNRSSTRVGYCRQLRVEPLEDRRMLSLSSRPAFGDISLLPEADIVRFDSDGFQSPSGDGLATGSYALLPGSWGTNTLTYSYSNFLDGNLPGGLSAAELRAATEEAFGLWAKYAPLHFVEVADSGPPASDNLYAPGTHPQIRIGHHFIDNGLVLAHAFAPPAQSPDGLAGDVHLDDADRWSIDKGVGVHNVIEVLTHEIGHALGLDHSNDLTSIMYPIYHDLYDSFGTGYLSADDIAGIRAIYGAGVGSVTSLINVSIVNSNLDTIDGDYSYGNFTLREALALAPYDRDTAILFSPSLHGQPIQLDEELVISSNVSIEGRRADLITIVAHDPTPTQKNGDGDRIFRISSSGALSPTVLIKGLTLTGGDFGGDGGAVFVERGTLTIAESVLENNTTQQAGGAVAIDRGQLAVRSSALTGNHAIIRGGAIATGGRDMSYHWQLVSGPPGVTLPESDTLNYEFTPTVEGLYRFLLTVMDNYGGTSSAERELNVAATMGDPIPLLDDEAHLQIAYSTASDSAGNFVAAWLSRDLATGEGSIYVRRYDPLGNPLGGTIQVNSQNVSEGRVNVSMNAAGEFVVVWDSGSHFGVECDILARRFDASGNAVGDVIIVNAIAGWQIAPEVALLPDGKFIVAWDDRTNGGIWYRGFNSDGTEWLAATHAETGLYGVNPNVDAAADGSFAIGWRADHGTGWDIYARRFNSDGSPRETEFHITAGDQTGNHGLSGFELSSDGTLLVGWSSPVYDPGDNSPRGLVQRFDLAGNPIGFSLAVSETTAGAQTAPQLAVADNGDFVALWTSSQDADGSTGVYARRFTAAGTPLGGEFRIHALQADDQVEGPQGIAAGMNGRFLAIWTDYTGYDGDPYRAYAQIFSSLDGPFDGSGNVPSQSVVGIPHDDATVTITAPVAARPSQFTTLSGEVTTIGTAIAVSDSLIANNSAQVAGGGIAAIGGSLTVTNSTLSGNNLYGDATSQGAAIYSTTHPELFLSTVTNNTSSGSVGGVFAGEGVTIDSTIVAGNFAQMGPIDIQGTTMASYSIVGHAVGTDLVETSIGQTDGSGNFVGGQIGGAIDPKLGLLTLNGGRSFTHAVLPDSLAVNGGNPAAVAGTGQTPLYDQRGTGYRRVDAGRVDIGAYEYFAPIVVSATGDVVNGDHSFGDLTLREAIDMANTLVGPDAIVFDSSVFSIPLTIYLTHGQLNITEDLSLTGSAVARITIDAQQMSRVLTYSASSGNFTIVGLTVTGGHAAEGGNVGSAGGGIRFDSIGLLEIRDCAVIDNSSKSYGGGVSARGALLLQNSLVAGNATIDDVAWGGGIYAASDFTSINSTISNNSTAGIESHGGGIFAFKSAELVSTTVVGNSAADLESTGGIAIFDLATVKIINSLVAENSSGGNPSDMEKMYEEFSRFFDVRYSLIGDISGLSTDEVASISAGTGNLLGVDPLIGLLADNGGGMKTHSLLPGSPALNTGDPASVNGIGNTPLYDQRGAPFSRVRGGRIDIGAFEAVPQIPIQPGDYDHDDDVDQNDYAVWLSNYGSTTTLDADGNHDGVVDTSDYVVWRTNLGSIASASRYEIANTAIVAPEKGGTDAVSSDNHPSFDEPMSKELIHPTRQGTDSAPSLMTIYSSRQNSASPKSRTLIDFDGASAIVDDDLLILLLDSQAVHIRDIGNAATDLSLRDDCINNNPGFVNVHDGALHLAFAEW